jgi:ABC-2 type transport system ATP-binding protein
MRGTAVPDHIGATIAVHADHIAKTFSGAQAVKDVSLTVPAGMIYGILGPNGAGKTTSLRMLLAIIDPDSGHREILGEDDPRRVRSRIGYLPEERGLYQSMTARESIAFMGALRGLSWSEGRIRADKLLASVGLADAARKKIRHLSKGMAQLVQVLGALVHQPDLLILDEPFSGLDPVNQELLEGLIRAEQARGATVLFSTHVMGHAERLCGRLAIIAGGRCRFEGTIDAARAQLPLQGRYVPAKNVQEAGACLPEGARLEGNAWRFTIAEGAADALLARLVSAGHGVAGLSIERPGLHEAFVHIVNAARMADAEELA